MRKGVSIRVKIFALVACALTISLLSYLFVGTRLIVEDKTSYIFDFNLSRVEAASDKVDQRLQRISGSARVLGSLIRSPMTPEQTRAIEAAYRQFAPDLHIPGLLVLAPIDEKHFRIEFETGEGAKELRSVLDQMGWSPAHYALEKNLIGTAVAGKLPLGGAIADADGKPLMFFTLVTLDTKLLGDDKIFQTHLIDTLGNSVLSNFSAVSDSALLNQLTQSVLKGTFESGAREWSASGKDFIVSYKKLGFNRLTMLGFISKDAAFDAARALVQRSLVLGVSILLVIAGLTLVFVRSITRRLREMWHVTQRVSQGDFSVRVESDNDGIRSKDEILSLGSSFNMMAEKINDLMSETAKKARMEKELETAQFLQQRFFPVEQFTDPNLVLSGKAIPATECAGDWWHYSRVGKYLVVVIGDVTGHGVSAALVTAAVHGAFSIVNKNILEYPENEPSLDSLMQQLNSAVVAAAGGGATMTFLASVIDLDSGLMKMANASHRPPYLFRNKKGSSGGGSALANIKPLMGGQAPALGYGPTIEISPDTVQLEPGDLILWYTDGLTECTNPEGEVLSKRSLAKMVADLSRENGSDANKIAEGMMQSMTQFLGAAYEQREDDITVVTATIPPTAAFGIVKAAA